jgi:2-methylcitrate dehydratase PrpD
MPTASETLARFAAALRFEDLPQAVLTKVELHVLDFLGVALAGSAWDFGASVRSVGAAMGGEPMCTVIGGSVRMPAVWAALVNGTYGHGLDFDDTHTESVVHVSASVVPAALAACEESGASGRDFLLAVALGMESNIRIGLVARGGFHDRGFHPTGVCGTFAAALIGGKILGFDATRLTDALGLANSQAAGSLEFLTDGSWAKRMHGGWAAHSGLVAARLTAAGFTGPKGALDGRFGLYRSHLGGDGWDLSRLTDALGERWELLNTGLKPYPCCHYNHAFVDCVAILRQQHGISADDVERVECLVPAQVPIVCEPEATKKTPQNDYDAKFSLPYAIASILVRGHLDVDDFTPEAIRDRIVLAMAQRVVYRDDPQSDFPAHFPGWVRIHLRGGQVVEHREPINRGSAEKPLSEADVGAKFLRNANRAVSKAGADEIIEAVAALADSGTLSRLGQALGLAHGRLSLPRLRTRPSHFLYS